MTRQILAILSGIRPDKVSVIGRELIAAGICMIEVPLNSPAPFDSIARLAMEYRDKIQIGAGTVLTTEGVAKVKVAEGRIVVSPDTNPEVIRAANAAGRASFPGVMTPTECFSALRAGANALKFLPASLVGPDGLKAVLAVLPRSTAWYAVGGAGRDNFAVWRAAGAAGLGIGTALYQPGLTAAEVRASADRIEAAYDEAIR